MGLPIVFPNKNKKTKDTEGGEGETKRDLGEKKKGSSKKQKRKQKETALAECRNQIPRNPKKGGGQRQTQGDLG